MKTASSSDQRKLLISGGLIFTLSMLAIAAIRVSDPVVGARWQGFIELVIALMGLTLLVMGVFYAVKRWKERQTLRHYYHDGDSEKSEVPVTPGSFALTQAPTHPSEVAF